MRPFYSICFLAPPSKEVICGRSLEALDEVADAAVPVGDGGEVWRDAVGALGVDLAAGEGEAAHDLDVAPAGGQVDRVEAAAAVGHVHQAAQRAQRLRGGQQALAAAQVEGGVARLESKEGFLHATHCINIKGWSEYYPPAHYREA